MAKSCDPPRRRPQELYASLPLTTPESIRILTIEPGELNARIRLEMRVVALPSNPNYEALSYTWGGSRDGRSVQLNQHFQLPVTDNLFNALRRLRRRSKPRIIWIDALCINQADLRERASQVAIMGRIYKNAECVDIWLGEVDKEFVPRVRDSVLLRHLQDSREDDTAQRSLTAAIGSHFCPMAQAIAQALDSCDTRWCDRTWVMQEYALAKKRYLCFGRSRVRASFGRRLLLQIESLAIGSIRQIVSPLNSDLFYLNESEKRRPIHEWIRITRHKQTSDPRDHVYAILALLIAEQAHLIVPDYTFPIAQTFANASLASIVQLNQAKRLYMLAYVTFHTQRTQDLPTWAIDFSHPPEHFAFLSSIYRLERRSPRSNSIDVAKMMGGRLLTLQGRYCDTVSAAVPLTEQDTDESRNAHQVFLDFLEEAVLQPRQSGDPATKRSHEDGALSATALLRHVQIRPEQRAQMKNLEIGSSHTTGNAIACNVSRCLTGWDAKFLAEAGKPGNVSSEELRTVAGTIQYATITCGGASLFATNHGMVGIAPMNIREGDEIIVVDRDWPFMVLRRERPESYAFCGLAYVHRLTHADFWEALDMDDVPWQHCIIH